MFGFKEQKIAREENVRRKWYWCTLYAGNRNYELTISCYLNVLQYVKNERTQNIIISIQLKKRLLIYITCETYNRKKGIKTTWSQLMIKKRRKYLKNWETPVQRAILFYGLAKSGRLIKWIGFAVHPLNTMIFFELKIK